VAVSKNQALTKRELLSQVKELKRQLASRAIANDALINSLDEGLVVIGPDGSILRVNTFAVTALGFSEQEMLLQRFSHMIVAVDDRGRELDPLSRPMAEAFIEGKPVTEYTNLRRKNGTLLPVALTASPVIIDGKPAGAIDVFRDLTKERQLDLAKNDFVSLASHQLRTPASGVKAILHMLGSGDFGALTEVQHRYVQRAMETNDRQLRIIEDLLNVARADAGTLDLNLDYLNVAELVRSVALEHMAGAQAKQQRFVVIAQEQMFVMADGQKLGMAMDNLISNAIKYTPPEGRVTVRLIEHNGKMEFCVEDTGVGIEPDQLHRIFDKFGIAVADHPHPGSGDSTGLGLYLAKQVVALHNGDIQVESVLGQGSTFRICLPVTREAWSR
jgi:PAS domain S-box-containing protein